MEAKTRRETPLWRKWLTLLVTVVVMFGVVEVVLRVKERRLLDRNHPDLLNVASNNPKLVYEYRPNARVNFPGIDVELATNSSGFRDTEFDVVKRPGVCRIIALGDSVTVGWDTPREEIFAERLERRFEGRAEIYNLAVGGYNSIQEVETLKVKGLRYEPDLVVLFYVLNDNKEDGADGGLSRYFTTDRAPLRLMDEIRVRSRRISRRFGTDVRTEAFRELAAITRPRNLPVLVVVFPQMVLADDGSYGFADRHEAVNALCDGLGFEVLDLYAPLREAGFEQIRNDPTHVNADGHKLVADLLFQHLDGRVP